MLITGPLKEIRSILERAISTNAEYINFVAPNHVLIFHGTNNEYTYFKTTSFISHSALLTKHSFVNLRKFLRKSWSPTVKDKESPFYGIPGKSIAIKSDEVIFDDDEDFTFDLETGFVLLGSVSPINEKVNSISFSKIEVDKPYLKLKPSTLKEITKRFKPTAREITGKSNHINLNTLYVDNDRNLVFKRLDEKNKFRYLNDQETERSLGNDFIIQSNSTNQTFYLYDFDILTLNQICKTWPVQNLVLIPFDDFYIVEAHAEGLVCKIHMKTSYFDKKAHQDK